MQCLREAPLNPGKVVKTKRCLSNARDLLVVLKNFASLEESHAAQVFEVEDKILLDEFLVFVKRQCRFALLAKKGFELQPMQYTFTVTLSRGYIPDICTNVKLYKRRPMKGLLNERKWQTITKKMALPSL